jgi:hypothetical protein
MRRGEPQASKAGRSGRFHRRQQHRQIHRHVSGSLDVALVVQLLQDFPGHGSETFLLIGPSQSLHLVS